jgi:tetratricopeptide (TPR) repeat protein
VNSIRFCLGLGLVGAVLLAGPAEAARREKPARVLPSHQRIDRAVDQLLTQTDVFWHRGDYDSVRACYAMITDLDPTYVEGWQNYGWVLWSTLSRDDAAMRVFLRGLAYNPNEYDLYFEIGNLEYHRRHFLSAAQWLAKATDRNAPQMVWHFRAHCLEYAGEIDKAKAMWRTIIRRFPNDAPAPANLKRLLEGRIHLNPVVGVEAPKRPAPPVNAAPTVPSGPVSPVDPNSV